MQSHQYQPIDVMIDGLILDHDGQNRPFRFPLQRLPLSIDLRRWMTPIENQRQMNTCAANAYAGACEYILKRRTGLHIDVSRLFIYYNGRMIQERNFVVTDDGASKQSIAIGLQNFGVCEEYIWPYCSKNVNKKPLKNIYDAARQMRVTSLQLTHNLTAMKTCLAYEIPFLIGIRLMHRASIEAKDHNGYVSMPNPNDPQIISTNTHSVLVVGYDDQTQHFLVRNSWGNDWGLDGYFYIPYQYLFETNLVNMADGIWAVVDVVVQTIPLDRCSSNKKMKKVSTLKWLFGSCSSRN